MKTIMIAAIDKHHGIGKNNNIPWHLPKDFKHFKQTTLNKCILMGRSTYDSIGRPLPKRTTIIMTKNKDYSLNHPNVRVANDMYDVSYILHSMNFHEIYICGGQQIYELFLPEADELILSMLMKEYGCDRFFPDIDEKEWDFDEGTVHLKDEKNECDFTIMNFKRIEDDKGI